MQSTDHTKVPIVIASTEDHHRTTETSQRIIDPSRGDHYGCFNMQPIQYILANNLCFCSGNVIKYVSRGVAPNASPTNRLTDLRKARHYIDMLIEKELSNHVFNTDTD